MTRLGFRHRTVLPQYLRPTVYGVEDRLLVVHVKEIPWMYRVVGSFNGSFERFQQCKS